jgi:hypothetical protein
MKSRRAIRRDTRLKSDELVPRAVQAWLRHTSVYLLRDRTDEDGNQSFGFYQADYSPRKAAIYLHNLTTILAD